LRSNPFEASVGFVDALTARRRAEHTAWGTIDDRHRRDSPSFSVPIVIFTASSAARLYWEYWGKGYFNAKGVSIPVAVSVFPDELYPAPRGWTEKAYPKLIHYNRLPKGGHFAAWEQPQLFSEEVRAGFRSLR
jgi:pimeloyl-ACP methyl ester carboxylesterase